MEIELTTALPCTHFRPVSITSHLELSIITGTRAMSGSDAIRLRKRCIQATESSIASSMLTSMIWAPFSTCWRATASASSYFSSRTRRANILLPVTLVRSPTLTNRVSSSMLSASRPDRRVLTGTSGTARGVSAATLPAMARMCSGVVPQQPPAMLTSPAWANSSSRAEVSAGVSSKPVSAMGLGRPALG
ncbi:Uncharacterised protein [Bordetella pertussis]|nr:Uncharacterised protein [Bordetella pertussis]